MKMSKTLYNLAKEAATKAVQFDSEGNKELAITYYLQAYDHLISLIKYTENKRLKEFYLERAENYIDRSYDLKTRKVHRSVQAVPSEMDEEKRQAILSTVIPEKPNVKWEDVAGLKTAKQAIEDSIILPLKHPDLFEGMPSWKGILLFGPPGCGKTLIARAAATECDATFFNLSSADLMVKWVGDSEQRIKTLFQVAKETQPSIIFLDEIDALGVKRTGEESGVSTRVLSQLLQGMDGVTSRVDDRIMVLGATNRPWNIDSALLRRFDKRIMIPLPDVITRKVIFKITIRNMPRLSLSEDVDLDELATLTVGYTGDDIKKICMDAWYIPIHEHIKNKIDEYIPRDVNKLDFIEALRNRKSSVTSEEVRLNNDWANRTGTI